MREMSDSGEETEGAQHPGHHDKGCSSVAGGGDRRKDG